MRDNQNMTGFILVLLAFVLMIAEAHIPSFGLLGLAAIISLLVGGKIIVDDGGIFGIPLDWPFFLGIAGAMMITLVLASRLIVKSLKKHPVAGTEGMIGQHATILEWDGQHGRVMAQGEMWSARSVHPHPFHTNDTVVVSAVEELTLHIRPKD